MSRRSRQKPTGTTSLLIGRAIFSVGGVMAIVSPVSFDSPGGIGQFASHPVTTVYTIGQTRGLGVFFLLIAVLLFCTAHRIAKDR
jgi:hypothetical protein